MVDSRKELIKKYIDYFKSKRHKEIPNSSLIPENDPTVLFTTAGMHPLIPYLTGQKHPLGKRLVNVQQCIRTQDIDEVGDDFHLTFFEMLGNWSLGDYFKKEAIEYSFEFLTKILKIKKERLNITCFKGDKDAPKDIEAAKIWQALGIRKEKIKFLPKSENWWDPAGETGPCGPDTEIFFQKAEIWNNVFMQYNKTKSGKFEELKQKNIDTGMGVERTIATLTGKSSVYETPCFLPIIKQIEKLSKKNYKENKRAMRIIADHIKASVMILAEDITPSNTEQGYVLRRLIRRASKYGKELNIPNNFTKQLAKTIISIYSDYKHLKQNKTKILEELEKEELNFEKTLEKGLNKFKKMSLDKVISGKEAFLLYQSYGFPKEMIAEECKKIKVKFNTKDFDKELSQHQKLSRTASSGKFKSGLADSSEKTTKLHTTTHLLNQALRAVLKKPDLHQRGSNITSERLRFDFNFDRKLIDKELKQIEDLVNKTIKKALPVKKQEMTLEQAKKLGVKGVFKNKYGKKVFVYSIGNFSKEICAGPHVENTKELGKFKIKKEESSSAGVRRIKGVLE